MRNIKDIFKLAGAGLYLIVALPLIVFLFIMAGVIGYFLICLIRAMIGI